uniref:Uncharacterized protein n=1 Tax=Anopheles minimus TaxID=112268 RepID=A0A182WPJ2_9DIPT
MCVESLVAALHSASAKRIAKGTNSVVCWCKHRQALDEKMNQNYRIVSNLFDTGILIEI